MPKIDQLVRKDRPLPALQKAVFDYLEKHPDEVYSANDDDLGELQTKLKLGTLASLAFSLWALNRDGHLKKEKFGRRQYYGSAKALAKLRAARNGSKP
jgi:hypothetical protein